MRTAINSTRILVAVLFIISGLVKANDPLGLSYKMQEFFEVWTADLAGSSFFLKSALLQLLHSLHPYTLLLSVVMITLEIMAGVALLTGWKKNGVLGLLLILMVFFTFLTAYAYGSGKFKNCGCFGDCLPITPLASLLKDVVLLALILFLIGGRKHIGPWMNAKAVRLALPAALVLSLSLQWYVLNYLPIADCLPFKRGNNIAQQMKIPPGAVPDSFAIRFVYEKGGKRFEFPAEGLPPDLASYTYVDRVDKLVRSGNAEPPIKGFALTGISGADSTEQVLALPQALVLFAEKMEKGESWMPAFKKLAAAAQAKGIPVFVASAAGTAATAAVLAQHGLTGVPVFALDFTAIRTAARTHPTLYFLEKGTIQQKFGLRQLPQALSTLQP